MNWYLRPRKGANPFNPSELASGLYGLVDDANQISVATDEFGLYGIRQEAATWGYGPDGKPSQVGAVANCLRFVTYCFRTVAADYSREEKIEMALGEGLRKEAIAKMEVQAERDLALQRRGIEMQKVAAVIDAPVRSAASRRLGRR